MVFGQHAASLHRCQCYQIGIIVAPDCLRSLKHIISMADVIFHRREQSITRLDAILFPMRHVKPPLPKKHTGGVSDATEVVDSLRLRKRDSILSVFVRGQSSRSSQVCPGPRIACVTFH
jgi:hypothetical protein